MKKYSLLILLLIANLSCTVLFGQLIRPQQQQNPLRQPERDWYNCSFETDSVYGAEVNRALEFLKGKKLKKRPIVALIGGGMDIEQEDLKEAIWKNPKEKADGKDNDKNGLVDDVHGWNFLGGQDGRVMETTLREGDREFLRLKDRYGDYIFDGKNYLKIVDGKRTIVPAPENRKEYNYYRSLVVPESSAGGLYGGIWFSYLIKEYGDKFEKQMRTRFPEVKELTVKEFAVCYDPKAPRDSLSEVAFTLIAHAFGFMKTEKWEVVYRNFVEKSVENAETFYRQKQEKATTDHRQEIVGDQVNSLEDRHYGNAVLLTSDAASATMMAGIIAGKRGNGLGGDGILDQAKIMPLRVCASQGEPYLKDLVVAMYYAIDHGADIIVLPQQNTLYPPHQKDWMSDALAYAEEKGVLVIVPVWELSHDLSKKIFYPHRWMREGKELTNLMVVAASDRNGNPEVKTNFGAKELDLFAPGNQIYSSYTGDTYKSGSGSALAAATVAGVAALLKAYYPRLTGSQIRRLLLENVTPRKGVEVEKNFRLKGRMTQDLFLFEQLCLSGGILNAWQAAQAAEQTVK